MADMRRALSRDADCIPRADVRPSGYINKSVLAELRLDIFNTLSKLLLADKSNDIGNAKSA